MQSLCRKFVKLLSLLRPADEHAVQAPGPAVGGEPGLRGALHVGPVPEGGGPGLPGHHVPSGGGAGGEQGGGGGGGGPGGLQ